MSDKRSSDRTDLSLVSAHGVVENQKSKSSQPLVLKNLSQNGLCIYSSNKMHANDLVRVFVSEPFSLNSQCQVCWCRPLDDGYLIGLKTLDATHRLRALHDFLLKEATPEMLTRLG